MRELDERYNVTKTVVKTAKDLKTKATELVVDRSVSFVFEFVEFVELIL